MIEKIGENMAFENLTERLQNVFKNLRKGRKITESDIQRSNQEIRLALAKPTLLYHIVKDLSKFVNVPLGMKSLIPKSSSTNHQDC